MDVQMPGMSGLEATAMIRKREEGLGTRDWGLERNETDENSQSLITNPQSRSLRVPIIAMTAHARTGDRQRCLAAGMDGYLSKPIDGREMIAVVESLAAGAASANTAAATPLPAETAKPPAPAGFDYGAALKHCLNKPDLLQQMIAFFYKDADTLLPQIHAALEKGELEEVGRLGHRMKGTLVHLAAEAAIQAARRVEQLVLHAAQPAEAEAAVTAFERECQVLKQAVSPHRSTASLPECDPRPPRAES